MAETAQLSPQLFSLLRSCLVVALLIHLPFLGMVIGGATVSLLLNLLGRDKGKASYLRLSKELIDTVVEKKSLLFLFGLLPLFPVALIYRQVFIGSDLLPEFFWFGVAGTLFGGFLFLNIYRASFSFETGMPVFSIGTGLLGLAMVVGALKLLILGTGIVFNPEKIPFLKNQILSYLSWNSIVRLLLFMALFFGIAAGAVLMFIGRRVGEMEDPRYEMLVSKVGSTMAYAAGVTVPVFLVFNLITLPEVALSLSIYVLTALGILVLMALCLMLCLKDRITGYKPSAFVFISYILVFLVVLACDSVATGNAYREQKVVLTIHTTAKKEGPKEVAAAAGKETAEKINGEAVFEKICTGCHRLDARLVGPPLMEVLPKYAGDAGKLAAFLRDPVKVNPDYPTMPKLMITESEIEAVVDYLLSRLEH